MSLDAVKVSILPVELYLFKARFLAVAPAAVVLSSRGRAASNSCFRVCIKVGARMW